MFCIKCGNKYEEDENFCKECGVIKESLSQSKNRSEDKWWLRLARVVYIFLVLMLVTIAVSVGLVNKPYYSNYYDSYIGSYGEMFGYTFLTLFVGILVLKFVKLSSTYVVFGKRPEWRKEFKKFF